MSVRPNMRHSLARWIPTSVRGGWNYSQTEKMEVPKHCATNSKRSTRPDTSPCGGHFVQTVATVDGC